MILLQKLIQRHGGFCIQSADAVKHGDFAIKQVRLVHQNDTCKF